MPFENPVAQRFTEHVCFITGAGNGIGAATAVRFHQEGALVAIADRELDSAQGLADQLGERALAVECDVRDQASVDAAIAATLDRFGRLDHLVTVAGGSVFAPPFAEQSDQLWTDMIDLNLVGAMRAVKAAIPALEASEHASVVMISSVNGIVAFGEESYGAAKAGLSNVARNLTVSHGPKGIRFNVVAPGTTRTRVWDRQPKSNIEEMQYSIPLGRVGEPADQAAAIAFLSSEDAAFISGITLPVDGGAIAGPSYLMGQLRNHLPSDAPGSGESDQTTAKDQ